MTRIISIILAFLCSVSGIGLSVIGYTDGTPVTATQRTYKYDKDTLLIGGYYARQDELQYAKDGGIDFLIAQNADKTFLDEAQKYGLGIIAAGGTGLGRFYGNMTEADASNWTEFDYSKLTDHPALWGCDMIDEPNSESFDEIQNAAKTFYDKTEKLVPFINLFPSYASNEQLTEYPEDTITTKVLSVFSDVFENSTMRYKMYVSDYINTIDTDYICVDIYPYSASSSNGKTVKTTSDVWLYNLDILAEACRETDRDLWVITQAAGETENGTVNSGKNRWCTDKSDISQQMYVSLCFGAKAIIHGLYGRDGWWDTDSHMIGSNGKPTATYYAAQAVNKEVKSFADVYGSYEYKSTYMLNSSKVAGVRGSYLNCTVEDEKGNIQSKNGLLIGTFDGNGKGYVIANAEELNNSVTATATVSVGNGKTATLYQNGKATEYTDDFTVTLTPGEGVFVTVI